MYVGPEMQDDMGKEGKLKRELCNGTKIHPPQNLLQQGQVVLFRIFTKLFDSLEYNYI